MRQRNHSGIRVVCHVAMAGLAGAMLLAAVPARADDLAPDVKLLDSIMTGLGLTRGGEPGIDYRQRSPLVIPPDNNLPPPQSAAVNNPNWPVDPETRQENAIRAMQKDSAGLTSSQRMDNERLPLLPSELEKGRAYGKGRPDGRTVDDKGLPLSAAELGAPKGGLFSTLFGSKKESEAATFTGEPNRTSLIDPPVGYQTPSPNEPYAVGSKTWHPTASSLSKDRDDYHMTH
jgi:hypothetical protein